MLKGCPYLANVLHKTPLGINIYVCQAPEHECKEIRKEIPTPVKNIDYYPFSSIPPNIAKYADC